jgi:hypothetical protein
MVGSGSSNLGGSAFVNDEYMPNHRIETDRHQRRFSTLPSTAHAGRWSLSMRKSRTITVSTECLGCGQQVTEPAGR